MEGSNSHKIEVLKVSEYQGDGRISGYLHCLVAIDGIPLECTYILCYKSLANRDPSNVTPRLKFKDKTVRKHKDYKQIRETVAHAVRNIQALEDLPYVKLNWELG